MKKEIQNILNNAQKQINEISAVKYTVVLQNTFEQIVGSGNTMVNIIANVLMVEDFKRHCNCRKREYVEFRQLACWFLKEYYPKLSLSNIGKLLNIDHTTVIYAIKTVKNRFKTNDEIFNKKYQLVNKRLMEFNQEVYYTEKNEQSL